MKKTTAIILLIFLIFALAACSEATKLSFVDGSVTVFVDQEVTPAVKIYPKKFSYTLSVVNETVATVVDGVKVKGIKEGRTLLRATSGNLTAECELFIMGEYKYPNQDVTIKPVHSVTYRIANYAEYGLETGIWEAASAIEGSTVTINDPMIFGYIVDCWFSDEACTVKYDTTTPVYSDLVLYAKITPRETDFNVINGYIVGLLYPNLPHAVLDLPATTSGGEKISGIADNAFYGDTTLKEVNIPAGYETIGSSAFGGCSALEKVTFEEGSVLKNVGDNAFGVSRDEGGKITDSCKSLAYMNLPDTVTEVGAFAFYACSALELDHTPPLLTQIRQYSFAETRLKSADLSRVTTIFEGGFNNCAQLDTVVGTEKVTECKKNAFDGTKLAADAEEAYTKKDQKEPGFYAGTILFGIYRNFGTGAGDGKYRIKQETTLIADNALNGAKQSELTLYIDTDIAKEALDKGHYFLGDNVFYSTKEGYPAGIFIVTGEGFREKYAAMYRAGDADYSRLFVEEEIVNVVGDDNYDVVNWGSHVLLYNGSKYFYDKYIPFEKGVARKINLEILPRKYYGTIARVNMNAFTRVQSLSDLYLGGVQTIAYLGITGCTALKRIYLLGNDLYLTTPEHNLSIQNFSGKIIVSDGSYKAYLDQWLSFGELRGKLIKESEYKF